MDTAEHPDRQLEIWHQERHEHHGERAEHAIAALPETLSIFAGRYRSLAVLAVGQSLVCRISVHADGALETAIFIAGDGDATLSALLVGAIWPSLTLVPATRRQEAVILDPLAPEANRNSCARPTRPGPLAKVTDERVLPSDPSEWPWLIGKALQVLAATGGGVLQIAFRAIERDAAMLRNLNAEREQCLAALFRTPEDKRISARIAGIDAMLEDPCLFAIEVGCAGTSQPEHRNLMALALFGSKATADHGGAPVVCSAIHLPQRIMPMRGEARMLSGSPAVGKVEAELEIGRISANCPLYLTARDRMRHLYILGATGTGKSTIMHRMLAQDMTSGEGVILIDPHGDLSREVVDLVPRSRSSDLVFADADEGTLTLSILPASAGKGEAERAADGLVSLFTDVLYEDTREAFGPVFEQYFRHAFTLLISAPPRLRRLSTLPMIFEDRVLRRALIAECSDKACASFWTNTAEQTSGDYALANFTPYITAKLTRLISTAPARSIFASDATPIDFRASMDTSKILIIRCAKGTLGEGLSRLTVSACLLKIREAAMARAGSLSRRPVRLYLDEFQCSRGGELAMLLAEGRKFGIGLTLANQSLGQIGGTRDGTLGAAILANAGSLLLFRLGAPDAAQLGPWLAADTDWRTLCQLPDFRMAGRLLSGGVPRFYPELKLPAETGGKP